jgi:antitoxin VapB
MSGRSQAIRWPAKLRLNTDEVHIEAVGETYLVRPQSVKEGDPGEWLEAFYARHERLPDDFLADRVDQTPQERDWSE